MELDIASQKTGFAASTRCWRYLLHGASSPTTPTGPVPSMPACADSCCGWWVERERLGTHEEDFFLSMTYGYHTDAATMSPKNGSNTVLELKMI